MSNIYVFLLLVLSARVCEGDFMCVCNYNVEKPVYPSVSVHQLLIMLSFWTQNNKFFFIILPESNLTVEYRFITVINRFLLTRTKVVLHCKTEFYIHYNALS